MVETWAPTLDDVGRHIPTRTRDTRTPGSDAMLGTFTSSTTPTGDQAQAVIDDAVSGVLSATGPLPPATDPNWAVISQAARSAAEWRAAADIEIAYPARDADVRVYAQLDQRAKDAMAALMTALADIGEGIVEAYPVWSFPPPPPWADTDPGSGIRMVPGFGDCGGVT